MSYATLDVYQSLTKSFYFELNLAKEKLLIKTFYLYHMKKKQIILFNHNDLDLHSTNYTQKIKFLHLKLSFFFFLKKITFGICESYLIMKGNIAI